MAPCTDWITGEDVMACCSVESSNGFIFDQVATEAGNLLFELSGRRYAGECSKTVRPCRTACGCGWQVLSRGHLVQWRGSEWWCDSAPCGCGWLSQVKLSGYPVRTISEVKIDGSIIDSGAYRLDGHRYLTRVRATAEDDVVGWPACQNLDLPDDQEGTFSITYSFGEDVPALGVSAAAELACEMYKVCDDATTAGECALPSGVTRLTRQGITIERQAFTSWGFSQGSWKSGLPLVDAFLNAYNHSGLLRRPTFWGPGSTHRYAQEVG